MNKKTRDYVKRMFKYPPPKRRDEFFDLVRPRNVSTFEVLLTQIKYISFRMWLLSIAFVMILFAGCHRVSIDKLYFIEAVLPYIATVGLIETNRSYRYNMYELEKTTRFSLRTVMYARMLIIGIINYLIIISVSGIVAIKSEESIIYIFTKMVTPYLITMALGLRIERHSIGRNSDYISVILALFISFIVIVINIKYEISIETVFHAKNFFTTFLFMLIVIFEKKILLDMLRGR